jgi:hypothetical protein
LAVDLVFEDPAVGSGVLRALACVPAGRWKPLVRGPVVMPESVGFVARKHVVFMAYDKGVESDAATPGRWVRLERRLRFDSRPAVSGLAALVDSARWLGGLAGVQEGEGFAVVGLSEASRWLFAAEVAGRVDSKTVDRINAGLVRLDAGRMESGRAVRGLQKACLGVGLVISPARLDRLSVPLGRVLALAAAAWDG